MARSRDHAPHLVPCALCSFWCLAKRQATLQVLLALPVPQGSCFTLRLKHWIASFSAGGSRKVLATACQGTAEVYGSSLIEFPYVKKQLRSQETLLANLVVRSVHWNLRNRRRPCMNVHEFCLRLHLGLSSVRHYGVHACNQHLCSHQWPCMQSTGINGRQASSLQACVDPFLKSIAFLS